MMFLSNFDSAGIKMNFYFSCVSVQLFGELYELFRFEIIVINFFHKPVDKRKILG